MKLNLWTSEREFIAGKMLGKCKVLFVPAHWEFFHFIFRSRREEWSACTRVRAKGMNHQQLESLRQGKCEILWFVFLFSCWCCLSQRRWGSCFWGIIAGTSVQLNHGLGHVFGDPFLFHCSKSAVGFFLLTVSRIHLKGEGQKARTKWVWTSIPTGRIPPFPGIPQGIFASFALILTYQGSIKLQCQDLDGCWGFTRVWKLMCGWFMYSWILRSWS